MNRKFSSLSIVIYSLLFIFVAHLKYEKPIKSEPEYFPPIVIDESEPEPEPIFVPFCDISEEERYVITCVVIGEACHSSFQLKMAVAQTIYEAMQIMNLRPQDLLYRYNGYCEPSKIDAKHREECELAVSKVFDYGEMISDKPIEFFYNSKILYSKWHESMEYVMTIDHCRFFCRK